MPDLTTTAILEATDQIAFSAKPDTSLVYANPACLRLLGLDALGPDVRLDAGVPPEYKPIVRTAFQSAIASGSARLETAICRDDVLTHFEGTLTHAPSDDEAVVIGILRDISDRKRAEEVLSHQAGELLKASETLDKKDQEIARALEQAKLYQQEHERAQELAKINEELEEEVRLRTEAEKTLTASLEEKEVLLKEIHHRVKNNMQVISSLLNLQVGEIKDDLARKLFEESQSRIRSMALVHEKLYESDDLASVDFNDYIDSLIKSIFRAYSSQAARVQLSTAVERIDMPLDQAIPCGLILNELVCNAIKYAFEGGGGRLEVELSRKGDDCRLIVADDGIGLPEEFDLSRATTLGLRLVSTLVGQIDGEVTIDRANGTTFTITFPYPDDATTESGTL